MQSSKMKYVPLEKKEIHKETPLLNSIAIQHKSNSWKANNLTTRSI